MDTFIHLSVNVEKRDNLCYFLQDFSISFLQRPNYVRQHTLAVYIKVALEAPIKSARPILSIRGASLFIIGLIISFFYYWGPYNNFLIGSKR